MLDIPTAAAALKIPSFIAFVDYSDFEFANISATDLKSKFFSFANSYAAINNAFIVTVFVFFDVIERPLRFISFWFPLKSTIVSADYFILVFYIDFISFLYSFSTISDNLLTVLFIDSLITLFYYSLTETLAPIYFFYL